MSDVSAANPYRPPTDIAIGRRASARPGKLTAICVIAIVLGVLGILGGAYGVLWLIMAPFVTQLLVPPAGPGFPAEMRESQLRLHAEIQGVMYRYIVPLAVLMGISLIAAVAMTVGGFKALKLKGLGRLLLLAGFTLGVAYEIGNGWLQFAMTPESVAVMQRSLDDTLQSTPDGPGRQHMKRGMEISLGIGKFAGITFAVVLGVVKLAYYLFSLIYLNREPVRILYLAAQAKA
jgi:hypothetical protein